MKEEYRHVPVLPEQTLELLLPQENGPLRILDGTVGFGGHSSLILKRNPEAEILGIDRDGMALEAAKENLSFRTCSSDAFAFFGSGGMRGGARLGKG